MDWNFSTSNPDPIKWIAFKIYVHFNRSNLFEFFQIQLKHIKSRLNPSRSKNGQTWLLLGLGQLG